MDTKVEMFCCFWFCLHFYTQSALCNRVCLDFRITHTETSWVKPWLACLKCHCRFADQVERKFKTNFWWFVESVGLPDQGSLGTALHTQLHVAEVRLLLQSTVGTTPQNKHTMSCCRSCSCLIHYIGNRSKVYVAHINIAAANAWHILVLECQFMILNAIILAMIQWISRRDPKTTFLYNYM